jgi:hypothetical protein
MLVPDREKEWCHSRLSPHSPRPPIPPHSPFRRPRIPPPRLSSVCPRTLLLSDLGRRGSALSRWRGRKIRYAVVQVHR